MKKILLVICLFLSFSFTCNAEVKSGSVEAKYEYIKDSKFYKTELKDGKAKMMLEDYKINFSGDEEDLDIVIIPVDKEENDWLKDLLNGKKVNNLYYINAYNKDGKSDYKGIYVYKDNKETKYIRTNEEKFSSVKYSESINLTLRDKTFHIVDENIDKTPSTGDMIIRYVILGILSILGLVFVIKKLLKKEVK